MKNKAHPLGSLLFPFAQMPVFISFFLALRAMASAPVASMQTEGAPKRNDDRGRYPHPTPPPHARPHPCAENEQACCGSRT